MKRFYDYDPYNPEDEKNEFGFDDNDDDELEEDEEVTYIEPSQLLEALHMGMEQMGPDINLIDTAVKIAEKNIFWRFRSTAYKMQQIGKIFKELIKIADVEYYDKPSPEENN